MVTMEGKESILPASDLDSVRGIRGPCVATSGHLLTFRRLHKFSSAAVSQILLLDSNSSILYKADGSLNYWRRFVLP